jgi:hypothetical protein
MDQEMVMIDITNEIFNKFRDYMDKSFSAVRLLHNGDQVVLETVRVETTPKNRVKETIKTIDLSFITDDPEVSDELLFTVKNDIEENIEKLLNLTPVDLINTTNLFSKEAEDKIDKKFRRFDLNK